MGDSFYCIALHGSEIQRRFHSRDTTHMPDNCGTQAFASMLLAAVSPQLETGTT